MPISYFGGALAISLAISALFVVVGFRQTKKGRNPNRLGGIGLIVSFVVLVLLAEDLVKTPQISGLLFGVFMILIFGVIDDFKNISWKKQLIFQVFLAIVLIVSGFSISYISGPLQGMIRLDWLTFNIGSISVNVLSTLLIIFWVVAILNAINWADGIDGLSSTLALLGALALVLVSLLEHVNQPAIAIISFIFAGGVCGLLWFNFPPAKIEAGSSGSYAIGFILASLAIIAGTKIATAMIVLAIPMIDLAWVVVDRFIKKKKLTARDDNKRHLHYRLRQRGWSDIKIVSSYGAFILVMLAIFFLAPSRILKLSTIVVEALLIIGFLVYMETYKLKQKQ